MFSTIHNYLPATSERIVVGVSGGVDSSVAAWLLKAAGYDVHAVFMKNWEETFAPGYCSAEDDVFDARDVCETIGIPLHTVNFSQAYQERVFAYFLSEYQAGRTPNPDVLCNREIKFFELVNYAKYLGAHYVATGHYCRRGNIAGQAALFKAEDSNKDQTYFLSATTGAQLAHAVFPIGDIPKPQVREIAAKAGLITHNKKDSTGICFIGERNFREFLSQYLPAQAGKIVTLDGQVIGEHSGLMYYTIGQRQGLGIGGQADFDESPWFVAEKRLNCNELVVVQGTHHPALYQQGLCAGQLNWFRQAPQNGTQLTARIRHRQTEQACQVFYEDNGGLSVVFAEKQRAICAGQYVVFYDQAECLGGGVIETSYDE